MSAHPCVMFTISQGASSLDWSVVKIWEKIEPDFGAQKLMSNEWAAKCADEKGTSKIDSIKFDAIVVFST